jgi:hypothetical protein
MLHLWAHWASTRLARETGLLPSIEWVTLSIQYLKTLCCHHLCPSQKTHPHSSLPDFPVINSPIIVFPHPKLDRKTISYCLLFKVNQNSGHLFAHRVNKQMHCSMFCSTLRGAIMLQIPTFWGCWCIMQNHLRTRWDKVFSSSTIWAQETLHMTPPRSCYIAQAGLEFTM